MRNKNLDVLKVICSFLIISIHLPFQFSLAGYYTALTRIAVPIFFIISGYFYNVKSINRQIKKIVYLLLISITLYICWESVRSRSFPEITIAGLLKFIVFNEPPVGYHLWYLGALLYAMIAVSILDKNNCRRFLYWSIPILLMCDLMLGKYSLLFFAREFPYIIVRNWLFVAIPFFSIGMLMKEKPMFRIGRWGIPLFMLTSILERYILVTLGLNATRDQYVSTIFLSISVFSFALEYKGNNNRVIVKIGRDYCTWIYIIHPIFIECYGDVVNKYGLQTIWDYIGPIVVFVTSLLFVAFVVECKKRFLRNHMSDPIKNS